MLISPIHDSHWARVALVIGFLLTILQSGFAHNPVVHARITESAATNALHNSIGYSNFLVFIPTTLLSGSLNIAPAEWMIQGSQLEDGKNIDAGGFRQFNHFYDPFTKQGLSDWPINELMLGNEGTAPYGQDSLTWASALNGPGIDVGVIILPMPIAYPLNTGTTNSWSFQNARSYEWAGLTGGDPSVRSENLADMFRAIGQVLHLLQDATSPQHVRNEQHLPNSPWNSPIETYGKKHAAELNYSASMLDWRTDGFTKLADFWDRGLYSTNKSVPDAAALDANEDPTDPAATLGAAEFVNGNFIGQRHSYSELTSSSSRFYYPLPSLLGGTTWTNLISNPGAHGVLSGSIPPIGGSLVYRVNVSKTGQGRYVTNHSTVGYIPTMNPSILTNLSNIAGTSVDDPDVLKDYHYHLIPTAVKYTAGLIDYYFRGILSAELQYGESNNLIIRNASSQDFTNGTFHLFYDDTNGLRTELSAPAFTTSYSNALAPGASISACFTVMTNATNYILVYRGTIGTTNGAVCDPVDSDIAVAATSFAFVPCSNAPSHIESITTDFTGAPANDLSIASDNTSNNVLLAADFFGNIQNFDVTNNYASITTGVITGSVADGGGEVNPSLAYSSYGHYFVAGIGPTNGAPPSTQSELVFINPTNLAVLNTVAISNISGFDEAIGNLIVDNVSGRIYATDLSHVVYYDPSNSTLTNSPLVTPASVRGHLGLKKSSTNTVLYAPLNDANSTNASINVYNGNTLALITNYALPTSTDGNFAGGAIYCPDNDCLYVTGLNTDGSGAGLSGVVWVLNASTGNVTSTINIPNSDYDESIEFGMYYNSLTKQLYCGFYPDDPYFVTICILDNSIQGAVIDQRCKSVVVTGFGQIVVLSAGADSFDVYE